MPNPGRSWRPAAGLRHLRRWGRRPLRASSPPHRAVLASGSSLDPEGRRGSGMSFGAWGRALLSGPSPSTRTNVVRSNHDHGPDKGALGDGREDLNTRRRRSRARQQSPKHCFRLPRRAFSDDLKMMPERCWIGFGTKGTGRMLISASDAALPSMVCQTRDAAKFAVVNSPRPIARWKRRLPGEAKNSRFAARCPCDIDPDLLTAMAACASTIKPSAQRADRQTSLARSNVAASQTLLYG